MKKIFLFLSVIFILACHHTKENLIVGKWNLINSSIKVKFSADSSYSWANGADIINGKWFYNPDDKKLRMISNELRNDTTIMNVTSVTKRNLVVTENNQKQVFVKAE